MHHQHAAAIPVQRFCTDTVLLYNQCHCILIVSDGPHASAGRYFPENPPARACFAVQTLPANGLVEIEAIAETS